MNTKQPEILAEIAANLPTEVQYSTIDKENPFALYCAYLDYVRPIEIQDRIHADKEKMDSMAAQMEQMRIEFESAKNVCEMYLQKEAEFKARITDLEGESNLYKNRAVLLAARIQKMEKDNKAELENVREGARNYKALVEKEFLIMKMMMREV